MGNIRAIFAITILTILVFGMLLVPVVSAGKFLNYGPLPGTGKIIPAVKYVPSHPSSALNRPAPLTVPNTSCPDCGPICSPVKIDIVDNVSDYPLYLRALSVGDIYNMVIEVDFNKNPEILSQVEPYFIQITRAEYCAESPTTGLVEGWVYPENVSKVSAMYGVISCITGWPPYGYADRDPFLVPPYISFVEVQGSKIDYPVVKPTQNIIQIPKTGDKWSGSGRFTQYLK